MKTISAWFVAFLAIILGLADTTRAHPDMDACFDERSNAKEMCMDIPKLITCLKKIDAGSDDDARLDIQQNINHYEAEIQSCPGFTTTEKCRDTEVRECKKDFYSKQILGDKTICNELQAVHDCLVSKLNEACHEAVIQEELKELLDLDRDCKSDNFNGGACSEQSIMSCGIPVYSDYKPMTEDDDEVGYKCQAKDVTAANNCLSSLAKQCTAEDMLKVIADERQNLKESCPPSN